MYISIDLGGSKTRVASSKDLNEIHKFERFKTSPDLEVERRLVNEAIQNVSDGEDIEYICIGVPGFVDRQSRTFSKIVNYPELTGKPYESFFDLDLTNTPLVVENDAALAGLGESMLNPIAKDESVVAYLTLSTGVGGVRIQDKKINLGQELSEPGHFIIVEDGILDPICGQKGCLHAYLSGAMFEQVYGEPPKKSASPEVWEKYGEHLATGVVNIVSMWDPEVLVIGGGLAKKFRYFEESMLKHLAKQEFFEIPKIVKSELGYKNGVYGGFFFIKQLLHKPE
jgi:glucokinase